ncbi:MAG: 2Fe-2S iron-sulfur cluster-binding protein [Desulfobaccales bacterium]
MINFTINGRVVSGEDGWTILEVAREHDIDIPTLCHHGAVEPAGACRLCMVEVGDGRRSRVVASCLYPIKAGLKVKTDSERIKNVRRWILQMLVDEHPGSEKLQALARTYGVTPSRFKSGNYEDYCILCGLCVRACDEVAGVGSLSFGNRGVNKEITTSYHEPSPECIGCGTCLYVCPTEAMEKFYKRVRVGTASNAG